MSSLVTRVTPTLDGAPAQIEDGDPKLRNLRVETYTPPVYIRLDNDIQRTYRLEALPADLVARAGRVEILSGDTAPQPITREFYVAQNGVASGPGTIGAPWSLAHAFAGGGGLIQPGDTIWIRGGTYTDDELLSFTGPHGTSTARITFRQYGGDAPLGERVIIESALTMSRKYHDLRGVELTHEDPVNDLLTGCICGSQGGAAEGIRLINCIIHDVGQQGCTGWLEAKGPSMFYGVICYNNGVVHNKDHGFYIHDVQKVVENCISFNNLARGYQVYDSSRDHDHITLRQCIAFNNGAISVKGDLINTNFLARVTAGRTSEMYNFEECVGFFSPGKKGRMFRIGTDGNFAQNRLYARRCYFWGGKNPVEVYGQWKRIFFEDNTIVSDPSVLASMILLKDAPVDSAVWERNNWYHSPTDVRWQFKFLKYTFENWKSKSGLGATDTAQTGEPLSRYFLFPNKFEPGRAHLAIFNHQLLSSVPVDLSSVLPYGSKYEIRNVQDLWGTPTVRGTYGGGVVAVPMGGVNSPVPTGPGRVFTQPPKTAPQFDAFLVLKV